MFRQVVRCSGGRCAVLVCAGMGMHSHCIRRISHGGANKKKINK